MMYEGYVAGEEKGVDLLDAFPLGFAFFCALIFAIPVVKSADLAYNFDVMYWFGVVPMCTAVLPVVFLVAAYLVNRRRAASTKIGIFIAIFGSALALLLLGQTMGSSASNLVSRLGDQDCLRFSASASLEDAYTAARDFLEECKEAAGVDDIVIQECDGYGEALKEHKKTWTYLQHCEEQFQCAGWCSVSPPLWTLSSSIDDHCSVVIGQMMGEKVKRTSSQLLGWSLGLLSLASLAFAVLLPAFRKAGLDW